VAVESRDGEIHVRNNAMLGYAGEPDSWGREWIATGDLGDIDEDGFLHIEGRVKNVLISSYGRNISPEWVESEMLADGLLADCVVFGDDEPYCVALLSPRDPGASNRSLQKSIDRSNKKLPDYARVRQWFRLSRPLIMERGLHTENGRPKRRVIEARFSDQIAALYRDAQQTIATYGKTA
jgi:long-subunit acyl-CoA synthetase (AMP-forming)